VQQAIRTSLLVRGLGLRQDLMFIVTFYSFKGGVGRTLALMNTAYRLSQQGKSVFVLDFDLEAPGVDVFFPAKASSPGVLDCIAQYLESGSVPPLKQFVSEIPWNNAGKAVYMSAGRRGQNYQSLLGKMNWKDFYARHEGFYFIENLKGAIQVGFKPDYVLIDSRTGLTDISGICTLQLPDLVVLLFGLNEQNLVGTAQIYRTIMHNPHHRSIQTLLVASPVPDVPPALVGIKGERLKRANELLKSDPDLVLPYNAFVAFKETILPAEMGAFLNQAYDQLCERVVSCNKADISTLLEEAKRARDSGDFKQAQAIFQEILEANPNNPQAWTEFGSLMRSAEKYERALKAYHKAEELRARPSIYGDIAVTALYAKDFGQAKRYLTKFLKTDIDPSVAFQIGRAFAFHDQALPAIELFKKVAAKDNEMGTVSFREIGNLYLRLGQPKKALRYYKLLLKKSPNDLAGAYNIGAALTRLRKETEATEWYRKAIALFERPEVRVKLPGEAASLLQSMSQAYAATGNFGTAIARLNEAISKSRQVKTDVFSGLQYRTISRQEFVEETRHLLEQFKQRDPKSVGIHPTDPH
jgi:tetratricopeptide (TPR) repeat protein/MinD-like ATPase involved in chromosome partitioning or flagellar assembly